MKLEADQLIVILNCMLYSTCQAEDSWINVVCDVEEEHQHKAQLYTIIDTIYKLMEVSGVRPEHYRAMLNECRWYFANDADWDRLCNYCGYKVK